VLRVDGVVRWRIADPVGWLHASDCAMDNAPALPADKCDCGLSFSDDPAFHGAFTTAIVWPGTTEGVAGWPGTSRTINAEQFPVGITARGASA